MEIDVDGEKRVSKGRDKDRVRTGTCSEEEDGKHLSKDIDDDDFERRRKKRSLKDMEKKGRERSHRGCRVIDDKPSDDRQMSRGGRRESESKRRGHQASDDDEEGEIKSGSRGREMNDRGNEGLLKRDRRERDLTDGRENGNRHREIERKDRYRRDHGGRYNKERRHGARKDDSRKREEKTEDAKPKLPELNPSENNSVALGKTGEVYIPPFKLECQRLTWDALRKSINGLGECCRSRKVKTICSIKVIRISE